MDKYIETEQFRKLRPADHEDKNWWEIGSHEQGTFQAVEFWIAK
jgi:hypothetical protein